MPALKLTLDFQKNNIVSFYALKQTLIFLCHEYVLFMDLWPQRRILSTGKKFSPILAVKSWGTIFQHIFAWTKFLRMHIFLTQKIKCLFQGIK